MNSYTGAITLETIPLEGDGARSVQLLSVPLYAIGQLHRLMEEAFHQTLP